MKRTAIALVAALAAAIGFLLPQDADAQTPDGMRRIGILFIGRPPAPDAPRPAPSEASKAFGAALNKAGYFLGKNLSIERRVGEYDQLPAHVADLERLKVEVMWVIGTRAARIVQGIVKATPLVIYSCDPFEHVTKLSRPDSNVTGTTCMTTELSPKRLELLKELIPGARRVAFFHDPHDAPLGWSLTQEAARKLGIKVESFTYENRDDIPRALERVASARPDAVLVYPDAVLSAEARQLAQFWLAHSLPAMNAFPEFADAGGLMAYGAISTEVFGTMGAQVAKILDGARPGDVPVQRATLFHLVINLKTAKALGVTVPQSLLIRADRVIE
jgi:putative ABC transport system substrate-binding protein